MKSLRIEKKKPTEKEVKELRRMVREILDDPVAMRQARAIAAC